MKFLIIISIISALALGLNAEFPDLCIWQKNRDNAIKNLTPNGQSVMMTMLKDLQYTLGVAVQPIYEKTRAKYPALIKQLEQTDNQNFQAFLSFLGYGNPNCGAGDLSDLCQVQATGTVLFFNFKKENQPAVLTLLNDINDQVSASYLIIYSIVAQKNEALVNQLVKYESQTNLVLLAQAMGSKV